MGKGSHTIEGPGAGPLGDLKPRRTPRRVGRGGQAGRHQHDRGIGTRWGPDGGAAVRAELEQAGHHDAAPGRPGRADHDAGRDPDDVQGLHRDGGVGVLGRQGGQELSGGLGGGAVVTGRAVVLRRGVGPASLASRGHQAAALAWRAITGGAPTIALCAILRQQVEDEADDKLLVRCVALGNEESERDQGRIREPRLVVRREKR
ncbi:MAG: hypothetical protein M0Z47_12420, partial [Actinomycetota bacterium]|nr:hypothetical protein [Actinomycetota bacterium]